MTPINLLIKLFYKLAKSLEQASASQQMLSCRVEIHPSSTLNFKLLQIRSNCSIIVGKESNVGGSVIFEREDVSVLIGDRVFMYGKLIAAESINLGNDILIAWGVTILDNNSHPIAFSERAEDLANWRIEKKDWSNVKTATVTISDKTWIGFNSIILKGVTIGEGAIVGAGSVVTKDVPAWTIVAGNPARVIREIPENER
jgi:acetyltransferase-like isoleucine patch superfamily enzyme